MLCAAALDLVQNPFIANTGGTDGLGLWTEVANVPWTGAGLAACAVERPRRTPDDSAVELALVVLLRGCVVCLTAQELWSRMRDHLSNFYGGNYITSLVIGFRRRPVKRWKADYVLHSILSLDLTTNLFLGNTSCLLSLSQNRF